MKKVIRLTEWDLTRIVKRVISEQTSSQTSVDSPISMKFLSGKNKGQTPKLEVYKDGNSGINFTDYFFVNGNNAEPIEVEIKNITSEPITISAENYHNFCKEDRFQINEFTDKTLEPNGTIVCKFTFKFFGFNDCRRGNEVRGKIVTVDKQGIRKYQKFYVYEDQMFKKARESGGK